jgi:hypothetical protein
MENSRRLRRQGWDVLVIRECQIRDEKSLEARLERFLRQAKQSWLTGPAGAAGATEATPSPLGFWINIESCKHMFDVFGCPWRNSMLAVIASLACALVPDVAIAAERKVLIRSEPSGAKVQVVGGYMTCRATNREGSDGCTPCTFSIDSGAFDADGRYWERSKLWQVPLKITVSRIGYIPEEVYLTCGKGCEGPERDQPRVWKGTDVGGRIERTFYFVKQDKFDVLLHKDPDYDRRRDAEEALRDCKRFYEQSNPKKALHACNVALGFSGDNPDADIYHYRCMSNYLLNNLQAALADCQELTRLRRDSDVGWNNTGLILQGLRRHAEAITNFGESLRLNPGNVKALHNRALSYERLNRISDALQDCETALKLAPGDVEILALRAHLSGRQAVK